jgi:5-methylcytosine-specific restriction endonuclease McrA
MLVVHGFQRKVRDAIARQLDRAGLVHRFGHGHVWEMNHITPVKDGGGLCGLDGLETLCLRCHRTETKQQRGRWAREKRLANGEAEQLSLLPS